MTVAPLFLCLLFIKVRTSQVIQMYFLCCVIKVFGGVFMLSLCFLDCSVGVGVFVTGLSQISSFFSCLHTL